MTFNETHYSMCERSINHVQISKLFIQVLRGSGILKTSLGISSALSSPLSSASISYSASLSSSSASALS